MVEQRGPGPDRRVAEHHYNFLGLHVSFSSDRPETLSLLDAIYGHFLNGNESTHEELGLSLRSSSGEGPAAILDVMGRRHPLADPPLTDVHAYSILLGELFHRLGDYFLVHGACVTDGERSLLVTGPSGRGKTTLSLNLLGHGFRLLSDDLTPLGRRDGLVRPFPKRVGVKRDPRGELPGVIPGRTRPVPLGDKWLLDPVDLQGSLETKPRRLTHLLLLEPDGTGVARDQEHRFRIALVHGQDEFAALIEAIRGVDVKSIATRSGRSALDVHVTGAAHALSAFYEACSAKRHQIIHFQPCGRSDGFEKQPSITPCETWSAALSTMREVLNRESEGALLNSMGGGLSALLMELASNLQGVRCARLRVGDRAATARLVADWVGSNP